MSIVLAQQPSYYASGFSLFIDGLRRFKEIFLEQYHLQSGRLLHSSYLNVSYSFICQTTSVELIPCNLSPKIRFLIKMGSATHQIKFTAI